MADKSFADALNEQIANEFAASQQYVGMAVYYDADTLPRLAAFFYRQALEEREHAMMMVQYLLDVGEEVQIPDIKAQATSYSDGMTPVKQALAQEKRVGEEIFALFELAREIATREGAKAVLDGEIVRLGQSYVVSARLVSARDGAELATFRETAGTENELIGAIGDLSRAVRAKAGESLRTIRASSELERVTTPSLAALRKYVEGSALADEAGEGDRGLALLEEAVALSQRWGLEAETSRALAALGSQGTSTNRDRNRRSDRVSRR